MIKPKYFVKVLSENLKRTENPLGVRNEKINIWWKRVKINRQGEWFFFTGMLYQLTPYIEASVKFLGWVENSKLQKLISLSKSIPFSLLNAVTPKKAKEESEMILSSIYTLLARSGVDVFYSPQFDFYSGVLLYDLGDDEGFERHAKFVGEKLKSAGIKKIVTLDPHTTYTLKILYPRYAGVEFEVKSYVELLNGVKSKGGEYVIHDPCYYGRYLELSDTLREVMDTAGVYYRDVKYSRRITNCCGGPIDGLSPKISKEIAKLRVKELGNSRILTFCPICLANLRRAGGNTVDFSMVVE